MKTKTKHVLIGALIVLPAFVAAVIGIYYLGLWDPAEIARADHPMGASVFWVWLLGLINAFLLAVLGAVGLVVAGGIGALLYMAFGAVGERVVDVYETVIKTTDTKAERGQVSVSKPEAGQLSKEQIPKNAVIKEVS